MGITPESKKLIQEKHWGAEAYASHLSFSNKIK